MSNYTTGISYSYQYHIKIVLILAMCCPAEKVILDMYDTRFPPAVIRLSNSYTVSCYE